MVEHVSARPAPLLTWRGDEAGRAVAAVLLGCSAALLAAGWEAAAALVLCVGAAQEAVLFWAYRSSWRTAWVTVVSIASLVVAGPVIGRWEVVLVVASVSLAHVILIGLGKPRRRPVHRIAAVAMLASLQFAWVLSQSGVVAVVSVVVLVAVLERFEHSVERQIPGIGLMVRNKVQSWNSPIALESPIAPRPAVLSRLPEKLDPLIAGFLAGLLFAPMFYALARNPSTSIPRIAGWYNDFPAHMEVASRLGVNPVVVPPHPVFHLLTRLGDIALPQPVAATLVMSIAVGIAFFGLHHLARRSTVGQPALGRAASLVFATVLLIGETPAILLAYTRLVPPFSNFASFHVWNSPTETVSLAATLLLLPTLLDAMEDRNAVAGQELWRRLAVLATIATVAKPAFTAVLLVALPLHQLLTGQWQNPNRKKLAAYLMAPVALVLLVQSMSVVLFAPPEFRSGVTIEPLAVLREFRVGASGPVYFLGAVVVLLAAIMGRRRYLRATGVGLSWTALAVSVVPLILLRETGALAGDGNVAKLSAICWFVVIATSSRFIAGEMVARSRRRPLPWADLGWLTVTWVYVGAALASGSIIWHVLVNA